MSPTTTSTQRPVQGIVEAIFKLDLDVVKKKLMDPSEGEAWTLEQAEQYEMEYKQFLALHVKHPDEYFSPSKNIDKFWHAHILHTAKYMRDCFDTFGYFFHHEPSLPSSAGAAVKHQQGFSKLKELKEKEFASADAAAYCGRAPLSKDLETAAYCGRAPLSKDLETAAYCGRAPLSKDLETAAYCGRAPLSKDLETAAYCGRAPLSKDLETAAYCGRAPLSKDLETAAYCGFATPKQTDKQAAFSGLALPNDDTDIPG